MKTPAASPTVVVTGASSGIGRATAIAFAKRGARVALLARNALALGAVAKEVSDAGGRALILPLDISEYDRVKDAADTTERELGPIDVWVNNAMVSAMAPFDELTPEEFERITRVTYLGYAWGTRVALQHMKRRDQGSIVQVGSALAHRSIPLQSAYCGAKHAIVGMSESIRCELLHEKSRVRLSVVQLPGVNTPQFNWVRNRMPFRPKPVGTIYAPEVAADAIVWAALHPRKELLVGWPTYESVLGNRVFPALLDRLLARKVYREHFTRVKERERPDNLFHPVAVDYGIHGPYEKESTDRSPLLFFSKHRKATLALGSALAAAALFRRAVKRGALP